MAPAKTKDADFYVDNSGAALANSWLDQMRSSSGKAEGEDVEEEERAMQDARPSRLGLGAKFLPHSMALKANDPAAHRLENKLKGQKKRGEEKFEEAKLSRSKFGNDDEDESRTKAVKKPKVDEAKKSLVIPAVQKQDAGDGAGKKKKKKTKKGKGESEPAVGDGATKKVNEGQSTPLDGGAGQKRGAKGGAVSDGACDQSVNGKKKRRAEEEADAGGFKKKKASTAPASSSAIETKKPKQGQAVKKNQSKEDKDDDDDSAAAQNETQNNEENGDESQKKPVFDDPEGYVHKPRRKRVKGKKTRSKQKNLKKDNRPAHLKPGYQAPK